MRKDVKLWCKLVKWEKTLSYGVNWLNWLNEKKTLSYGVWCKLVKWEKTLSYGVNWLNEKRR